MNTPSVKVMYRGRSCEARAACWQDQRAAIALFDRSSGELVTIAGFSVRPLVERSPQIFLFNEELVALLSQAGVVSATGTRELIDGQHVPTADVISLGFLNAFEKFAAERDPTCTNQQQELDR